MRILILGATGMVGKILTETAVEAGHDVVAMVRSPMKLGGLQSNVTVLEGQYFDGAALRLAMDGIDAVLTTIGPPMKRSKNNGEYTAAMKDLVEVMTESGVRRIVAIAGAGVILGDEKVVFMRGVMRRILILLSGANYLDKENEHNALFQSDLDWTILRPPQITSAEGELTLTENKVAGMKADTAQLAKFMVNCLEDQTTIRTAPFVSTI